LRVVLAAMLVCVAAAGQELPPALAEAYNQGVQEGKAGHLDAAEKLLLSVLQQGGKQAIVYNSLGIVYEERREHDRAAAQFREAIRLNPKYAAPRILLGRNLLAAGRTAEATAQLERAVKLDPGEKAGRLELARAYRRGGNLRGAAEQFRELRRLAPADPEYAYQLAHTYMELAAWSMREIARTAPGSARAHQNLAETLLAQGRLAEAAESFAKAAAADPALPGIHLALAQIYRQQGKLDRARQEITRELEIVPESVAALAFQRDLDAAGAGAPGH
jgi:tetratricopeptide (TPR) repeat protein